MTSWEYRQLSQIERQLLCEDPRFVAAFNGAAGWRRARARRSRLVLVAAVMVAVVAVGLFAAASATGVVLLRSAGAAVGAVALWLVAEYLRPIPVPVPVARSTGSRPGRHQQ